MRTLCGFLACGYPTMDGCGLFGVAWWRDRAVAGLFGLNSDWAAVERALGRWYRHPRNIPLGGGRSARTLSSNLVTQRCGVCIPRTRQDCGHGPGGTLIMEMLPTAQGDPCGRFVHPGGPEQIVLSPTAAEKAGARPGDWLQTRFAGSGGASRPGARSAGGACCPWTRLSGTGCFGLSPAGEAETNAMAVRCRRGAGRVDVVGGSEQGCIRHSFV